jgi:predicted porin
MPLMPRKSITTTATNWTLRKVAGLHYFSDDTSEDGDQTYARFGIKGETQIASELTGYGQWEYKYQGQYQRK